MGRAVGELFGMGALVDLLGRIDRALCADSLDPNVFERCAADLLSEVYPGISPIPGGTDWGRDADIHRPGQNLPHRLLVTKAPTYKGVRANMVAGLASMAQHGVEAKRIVLANPAILGQRNRDNLAKAARGYGVEIEAVYDRRFFVSRLRRDGEWRRLLLGLSPEPVSISRLPLDLAESPWVSLTLAAREQDLTALRRSGTDLVVVGGPGVGKTRLVAALDEVVFIDPYAGIGQIADDLRAEAPQLVALDDAGQHLEILRGLVRLRRTESDLPGFRIIAVCWPDEDKAILDILSDAAVIDVAPLERTAIDEVVTAMGVTSVLARQQIVGQAHGRPGWAIALAAMFNAQHTWTSLFDGQVLLDEVERYLRQTGAARNTVDLLALIAAIGPVTLADLPAVATELGLPRNEARDSLTRSAHAGLVDVARRYDGERTYRVRPQMLADVLVANRAFRAEVPPFTLPALIDVWPEHTQEVARVAVSSTRLGAEGARQVAGQLVRRIARTDEPADELERGYAMLDAAAGRETLGWIRERFAVFEDLGRLEYGAFEEEIETCALIARRYLNRDAVKLLLDAALVYAGPTNRSTDPLSRLEEAVQRFHPELASTSDRLRVLIGNELEGWIEARVQDPVAWRTYAQALKAVLTPHRRTAIGAPADPNRFTLYEGLIGQDESEALQQHVWPRIRTRLEHAPTAAVKAAIDIATEWLRIGSGHDIPFNGQRPPQPYIDQALRVAALLIHDLKNLAGRDPGLTALLLLTANLNGFDTGLTIDDAYAAFFTPFDRTDNAASSRELAKAVAHTVDGWNQTGIHEVARKLAQIRSSLSLAHVTWPDRVRIACEHLARDNEHLADWIDAALEAGLFPNAQPFIDALIEQGQPLPTATFEKGLSDLAARPCILSALLSKGDDTQAMLAIKQLKANDADRLEALALPGELPARRLRDILTNAPPQARGRFALALFTMATGATSWPPAEIAAQWRAAVSALELVSPPGQGDRSDIGRLFGYLVEHEPAIALDFTRIVLQHVVDTHATRAHGAITERLHRLPPAHKTSLLTDPGYAGIRSLLVVWLVGPDASWTAEMLKRGTLTPNDVLMARTGFGRDELTIPQLAQLLVPHGVDPAQIAEYAEFGLHWGDQSSRYESLTREFTEYAASGDPHIALVGLKGVELFTERSALAHAREQHERVYGD